MVNAAWSSLFPHALLVNGNAPISDYSPIILQTVGGKVSRKQRRFIFENKWFHENDLPNIVRNCWTNMKYVNILERLTSTSDSLMGWAKSLNIEARRDKKRCEKLVGDLRT